MMWSHILPDEKASSIKSQKHVKALFVSTVIVFCYDKTVFLAEFELQLAMAIYIAKKVEDNIQIAVCGYEL